MTPDDMTPDDMENLDLETTRGYLQSYGADVSRWPSPAAGEAALRAHSTPLADDITEAKALDAALAPVMNAPIPSPSDLLQRRILKALPSQNSTGQNSTGQNSAAIFPAANDRPRKFANWRALAAAFVAIGAVSFAGLSMQTPSAPVDSTEEAEIWREAALDMGVDDVYDWVYSEDG